MVLAKKERSLPAESIPCGPTPMELLTSRELSQTTEVQVATGSDRVTLPDPSDTICDRREENHEVAG